MKSFNILLMIFVVFIGCRHQEKYSKTTERKEVMTEYTTVGKTIEAPGAKSSKQMAAIYDELMVTDTLTTKFTGRVSEVCQAKGCWMKVRLGDGRETMVKFKDYGFFVPRDIAGREVVVNGIAFVGEMSIEDQQHYAKDAGKTAEEIAAIGSIRKAYGFEADGVLIAQ